MHFSSGIVRSSRVLLAIVLAIVIASCAGTPGEAPPPAPQAFDASAPAEAEADAAAIISAIVPQIQDSIPGGASVLVVGFFSSDGDDPHPADDALTAELNLALLQAQERSLQVINRGMLGYALQEFELSLSGLMDAGQAQEVGGFLSADYLIRGTVASDFVTVEVTHTESLALVGMGRFAATGRIVFQDAPPPEVHQTGVVRIAGPGDNAGMPNLPAILDEFTAETGIEVHYQEEGSLEHRLREMAVQQALPDMAIIPQPGLLHELDLSGFTEDIFALVTPEVVSSALDPLWIDALQIQGRLPGMPLRVSIKSLVWYNRATFDRYGYQEPASLADLHRLIATIADDGLAPWSVGIESGPATGWVVTDWLEDLLLRTAGSEVYDAWVIGDLPFSSPEIRAAMDEVERLWGSGQHILQEPRAIRTTSFMEAANPLFSDPPAAVLHRQASFMSAFFPEEVHAGGNATYFILPGVTGDAPLLVAGDILLPFSDRQEVAELLSYLLDRSVSLRLVEGSGGLSPAPGIPVTAYPRELRTMARALQQAPVVRFDGSDMMPPRVSTEFWAQMTRWVAGEISRDAALTAIDAVW